MNVQKIFKENSTETKYLLWFSEIDVEAENGDYNKITVTSTSPMRANVMKKALDGEMKNAFALVLGFEPEIDYRYRDENGEKIAV